MSERTPDQIRRDTTPRKHYALKYGFFGGFLGAVLSFGSWGLFHQEQVRRYPAYVSCALRSQLSALTLFTKPKPGMSSDQLRYLLMRFGNEDHRYDAEIVRRGWYPKGENGRAWVFYHGAVTPVYSDDALMVFNWPVTVTLLLAVIAAISGLVADYRYRSVLISGIPFDGSIVATIDQYNERTKGDGMSYCVKPWEDR